MLTTHKIEMAGAKPGHTTVSHRNQNFIVLYNNNNAAPQRCQAASLQTSLLLTGAHGAVDVQRRL
jgi:hypothetical protein